jgi:MerR family transcriptional regulator/heat shock protein HspR
MAGREPEPRALYVISVAAELAGVHPQTLRIYERKGLIEPARTSGRSRRYSEDDIALLRRIQELTNVGVNLAGVQRVLDLEERLARAAGRIEQLEEEVSRARREVVDAVEAAHRSHRRDLVPLRSQAVVRYGRVTALGPDRREQT